MHFYKNKESALQDIKNDEILCNKEITKYFIMKDYNEFLNYILSSPKKVYYEYTPTNVPICLFFDVEIYKDSSDYYENYQTFMKNIIDTVQENLGTDKYIFQKIVLQSHKDNVKKSFHLVFRLIEIQSQKEVLFKDIQDLKLLYKQLNFDEKDVNSKYIIDPSVYRAGLFRTLYSSKNETPSRPLVKCIEFSDDFDDLESFVCYKKTNDYILYEIQQDIIVNVPEIMNENDKENITKFIKEYYHIMPNKIRDIFVDASKNCIIVALQERFCHFVEREHSSNNQYIIIDTVASKQKCHGCVDKKHCEIKLTDYPIEINVIVKKCLKINKQEMDLIDCSITDCKNYISNQDFKVDKMHFDKDEMIFRGDTDDKSLISIVKGKCENCKIEHQISNTGYCVKCIVCNSIFPKNVTIPIDDKYKNLNSFWMNYSQLVNNGTIINNINIYNTEEEFSCDVKLDMTIFNDYDITKIYNQVLDGHKIIKISELISLLESDFKYTSGEWFCFNNSIWKIDKESLKLKERIVYLSTNFNKIKTFYENKSNLEGNIGLIKNIKSLINKLYKPGFEKEIIEGAKMYYNDDDFLKKLNSKKHLLPFTNGVYDLIKNEFRETQKQDYINLTVGYDYIQTENQQVHTFLHQVLPNKPVRDYVLKKMSECLNGDIPNTNFMMFIGDSGANGKSQLLNLMKLTMGEFAEKLEVTLLTRKRNNANEANSEKIKLMNKRFAFLSEPETDEKINIGLLKELTGSEEIVSRGLYQESVCFVMETKLFLACNELPEIKGEDQAIWRRIRVVDFPSKFVDEPKEANEYKIDRTLPSRMREDISWKQTFMQILLSYYYKDITEPQEVKLKTNEYRQENNEFFNWLDENLIYKAEAQLTLTDICISYLGKNPAPRVSTKYKKETEKYIKEKYKNINHEYRRFTNYRGWVHLSLKD
jgi:P4 family phage/plasmid primase-like protien